MRPEMRESSLEMLRLFIQSHCRDVDPTETIRATVDAIQLTVGQELLRRLPKTRAYHVRQGPLEDDELLRAAAVTNLIREVCGMSAEPGNPIQSETRRWPPQRE